MEEADPRAVAAFELEADKVLTKLAEELAAGNVSKETTEAVEKLMSSSAQGTIYIFDFFF